MTNLTTQQTCQKKREPSDFEMLFTPYQGRLYRTALILTESPSSAKDLVQAIYSNAEQDYHLLNPAIDLDDWLSHQLINHFVSHYQKF